MERVNERVAALNDGWKDRAQRLGLFRGGQRWVYGGAPWEQQYADSDLKILWLLKETGDQGKRVVDSDSLPAYLSSEKTLRAIRSTSQHTYRWVARFAQLLLGNDEAHEDYRAALGCCAVINLKKTPGRAKARWSEISRWAERASGLWLDEIGLLEPNVVAAGGVYPLLTRNADGLSERKNCCPWPSRGCVRVRLGDLAQTAEDPDRKVCFLDYWHPAAWTRRRQMRRDSRSWRTDCGAIWGSRQ